VNTFDQVIHSVEALHQVSGDKPQLIVFSVNEMITMFNNDDWELFDQAWIEAVSFYLGSCNNL